MATLTYVSLADHKGTQRSINQSNFSFVSLEYTTSQERLMQYKRC